MTLYPGPVVSQEYACARDRGYADGEVDRAEGYPASQIISAARFDASAAKTRNERAWWLGYLRGYREAVRTRTFVRDADGEAISERWGT